MAGISSKALAFGKESTKKYQQYEFNSSFDISLYESFYRTHDSQLGRFWQLDPKPVYEMESLYNAMSNNPVSNIDILGDITHYYSSEGILLRSQNDGNEHATITVISDNNLGLFVAVAWILDNMNKAQKDAVGTPVYSESETESILRKTGVSYDTKEFAAYYDKHSTDNYKGNAIKALDNKGPLVSEHMAGLTLENGYIRVMDKAPDPPGNDPVASTTNEIGVGVDIHTHTSEGRRIAIDGRPATVDNGRKGLGKDILRKSWDIRDLHKNGVFDVVVTPTHVYLYRYGEVTIAVDRKNIPSKNPGEIK